MKNDDVLLLAMAGLILYMLTTRPASAAVRGSVPQYSNGTTPTRHILPAPTPTGGWYEGRYIPNLLDIQYEQGWGYGD